MKILLLGGAGFIGTNLVIELSKTKQNEITVVDRKEQYFEPLKELGLSNVSFVESDFTLDTDYVSLLKGHELVYHLVSTTIPGTSNQHISEELIANVVTTSKILEACVNAGVKKLVFISSGGTVYGKEVECPIKETALTRPITSYGVQKISIENLLYLYNYMYGLDYRIIRLANPYGPYQRPNGMLGAVTTFTYKALKSEEIIVYGDGSVVRDYIYIDDSIRAIENIVKGDNKHKVFNVGSGYGTSVRQVLDAVENALGCKLNITYKEARAVDVPVNYLDISRYEKYYGKLNPLPLSEGIRKTAEFLQKMK